MKLIFLLLTNDEFRISSLKGVVWAISLVSHTLGNEACIMSLKSEYDSGRKATNWEPKEIITF